MWHSVLCNVQLNLSAVQYVMCNMVWRGPSITEFNVVCVDQIIEVFRVWCGGVWRSACTRCGVGNSTVCGEDFEVVCIEQVY